MTLRDVLVSPPIWFDDRTITWTLPDAAAWWQMTWRGAAAQTRASPNCGTASPISSSSASDV